MGQIRKVIVEKSAVKRPILIIFTLFPLLLGSSGTALPLDEVNVHISGGASPNLLQFRIGVEQGYYKDEGLEVRLIQAGTLIGIQGLVAGSFDFSQIVGQAAGAILRGAPLRVAMVFDVRPLAWIYGGKKVKTIQDLRGKIVGVSAFGSGFDQMTRSVLLKYGIDPQRDVSIRATGTDPERFAALASGAVDGVIVTTLAMVQAKKNGFNELVFVGDEVESVSVGVVVNEKNLSDRPDFVRRFLRGTLQAFRWFKANEKGSVARLSKAMKISEAEALDIYKVTLRVYSPDGTVPRNYQEQMVEFWRKGLKVDKEFAPESVFDFRILQSLNKELGKGS